MNLAELEPDDWDALFRAWPTGVACPRWRLVAESPSPRSFQRLATSARVQSALRDDRRQVRGLLQVCDVDEENGYGSLGYLFVAPDDVDQGLMLDFLGAALHTLSLRKILVSFESDMRDAFSCIVTRLTMAGCLSEHTLGRDGAPLDRYVYEFPKIDVDQASAITSFIPSGDV